MEDKTDTHNVSNWLLNKKAPVTIAGVILLGIAGSALYDLFIKPGINGISRFVFDILTLGSQKVIDYSFNTAALDPTAIPSLILLIVLAVAVIDLPIRKYIGAVLRKDDSEKPKPSELKIKVMVRFVIPIMLLINVAIIFIPLNVFNQAVVTSRVFQANLTILSPALEHKKLLDIKAKFASMHTEQDYRKIEAEMEEIARDNNISLRDESPW